MLLGQQQRTKNIRLMIKRVYYLLQASSQVVYRRVMDNGTSGTREYPRMLISIHVFTVCHCANTCPDIG